MMSVGQRTVNRGSKLDPFYLYMDLVQHAGVGHVFLLDAAKDAGDPQYQMSIIGVHPALEIVIKEGQTHVFALSGLDEYLKALVSGLRAPESHADVASVDGFSSVVSDPSLICVDRDPMELLEDIRLAIRQLFEPDADPFSRGFLGYFSYDAVHYLEVLPATTVDDRALPDVRLQWHAVTVHLKANEALVHDAGTALERVLTREANGLVQKQIRGIRAVIADHVAAPRKSLPQALLEHAEEPKQERAGIAHDTTKAAFLASVVRAKEYIAAGDVFQVVLSRRLSISKQMHHYLAYHELRKLNPSPYMFMAEYPELRLFGTSPEAQFRSVAGRAQMKPIAGTSKGRGRTAAEDEMLSARLLADEKERAEHVMLVDLCRNDLGRVCEVGSIQVTDFMTVEPYSHLFHLVSTVRGTLSQQASVFRALLATFPAGTLSGAPKIRAMEIIDELEEFRRGPYGGMVGIIDFDANANMAITIRTVVETADTYYVQTGCGVVADSDPEQEWQECGHKAGALLDVLTGSRVAATRP